MVQLLMIMFGLNFRGRYNKIMAKRNLTCIVTGNKYTFAKDYYDKKVEEYTSEDNLRNYFITKKAKTYLNKGYSVREIRNMLNVGDHNLPGPESERIIELIDFHKVKDYTKNKRIFSTLNFATYKSDPNVTKFINNIKTYE